MKLRTQARRFANAALALALTALLLAASPPREEATRVVPAAPARPAELAVPFRKGEKLDYLVQWAKLLNAATIRLTVAERRNFYGREAWHFQAQAHTIDAVRLLFSLDDQFDSYTELPTLASLQYEMYLREQGKREKSVFWLSAGSDPAPDGITTVKVLPGTRDPIAFLYYLRTVDWRTSREVRSPVFDGRKFYEARARLAAEREEVRVMAGKFSAFRLEVRAFERGREVPSAQFWVWLARDARRTPVLVEAEIPLGSARVELSRAE